MDLASSPPQATTETGWTAVAAGLTLVLGVVTAFLMWGRPKPRYDQTPLGQDDDEDEPMKVHEDVPPEHMPEGGIFTVESLKILNGEPLPLCMGVCGKVVNTSASQTIRPGQGYGALWAGRDATYSLATLSLKPEDAGNMDFKLSDFTDDQKKALAGWYKHFTTKYQVIGTMREYDGWDFSEIELLAKDQTPFGMGKEGEAAEAEAPQDSVAEAERDAPSAKSAEASPPSAAAGQEAPELPAGADLPAGAQVFRKGARLKLQNLVSAPEKNGLVGILEEYREDKGRFVVKLEDDGQKMLVKPENMLIL